jgi:hypothetical protein
MSTSRKIRKHLLNLCELFNEHDSVDALTFVSVDFFGVGDCKHLILTFSLLLFLEGKFKNNDSAGKSSQMRSEKALDTILVPAFRGKMRLIVIM